ncbi:hypothetical protein V1264_014572 [Littorina saxatilis]|uniref:Cytochrome P450 n=1 Tax=Littorina saxatilis TaxID=31220 RepID=A0AAN9GJ46_9CAEN
MNNSGVLANASSIYSCVVSVWETWTVTTTSLLVLTVLAALTYFWITKYWPSSFERMRDDTCPVPLPPGNMGYPFIGETLEFIRKGSEFFASRLSRYGPVYKTHLLGTPMVRVVGGVHVKPVLLGEHVSVRSSWPASVRRLMGPRALLCQHGDGHRVTRRVVSSLFTPTVLATFVPKIQMVMDRHVDGWCRRSEEEGEILGYPACQEMSLTLTQEVTLGVSTDSTEMEPMRRAMKVFLANTFSMPIAVPGSGLWKGLRARQRILQEVRKKLESSQPRGDADFLSQTELMQQCPEFQGRHDLIEDNSLEIVFAAYATTSGVFCNTLLCLGRNPEVLRKVEAELEREGLLDDPSVALTYDVIGRLEYVHNVNREVMRMFPPAGAGFRKVIKTLNIGGCQIPKDWTVAYSIRETQQTSDCFPEPDRFYPDRWVDLDSEEMKEKIRFQYIPFGAGARKCVGRRLAMLYQAVFLVEVVRRCRFHLKNPAPVINHIPIVKPADDLPVTFRRRGTANHSSKSC